MGTPTFCDMIYLKDAAQSGNPHLECYQSGTVRYVHTADVIEYFNITETRYRMLVRDGYLVALKQFVTLDSFFHLRNVCKRYTSNENNLRVTNFPPLIWLKANVWKGIR